jgi:hypothetical protein
VWARAVLNSQKLAVSCPGQWTSSPPSVRAARGRLSAISVFLCKSVLYGAYRALKHEKRRFPARAVVAEGVLTAAKEAGLDAGLLSFSLPVLVYIDSPYRRNKLR